MSERYALHRRTCKLKSDEHSTCTPQRVKKTRHLCGRTIPSLPGTPSRSEDPCFDRRILALTCWLATRL